MANIKPTMQSDGISKNIGKALGWLGVALILAPKINIISVPGQTAGLRVDDTLLALALLFIIYAKASGKLRLRDSGYPLVILSFFASYIISGLFGWPTNPLYVFRLVEYSAFIYFGYLFARHYSILTVAILILIFNSSAIFLQFFGVWGGFTSDGYVPEVGRVVGLTAGPWEIGYILNVIFVIFLLNSQYSHRNVLLLSGLVFLLILLTGSRASAASFMAVVIIVLFKRHSFTHSLFYIAPILSVLMIFAFQFGEQLVQRSENLLNFDNITYVASFYQDLSPSGTFTQNSFDDITPDLDVDASWLIRSTHWAIALKEFFSSPIYLPFGLGPGTFGPALDGAWTRILVECGFVGLIVYIAFLRKFILHVPGGTLIIFVTVINMAFIDIHLSYKSMALLLFMLGFYLRQVKHEER